MSTNIALNITSISFSYLFLGSALIALSFYLYFRLMYIKTSPDNPINESIFGEMKHREGWRERNQLMSYISLFWTVISTILFTYLKFFLAPTLISILYLLLYLAFIVVSIVYGSVKRKAKT